MASKVIIAKATIEDLNQIGETVQKIINEIKEVSQEGNKENEPVEPVKDPKAIESNAFCKKYTEKLTDLATSKASLFNYKLQLKVYRAAMSGKTVRELETLIEHYKKEVEYYTSKVEELEKQLG